MIYRCYKSAEMRRGSGKPSPTLFLNEGSILDISSYVLTFDQIIDCKTESHWTIIGWCSLLVVGGALGTRVCSPLRCCVVLCRARRIVCPVQIDRTGGD